MHILRCISITGVLMAMAFSGSARAGLITGQGLVNALTDISQIGDVIGTADFETTSPVPLNTYSALGMDIAANNASFSSILPGIVSSGFASDVRTGDFSSSFPLPIGGGGSISGLQGFIGMVATFSVPVTQFGATFSGNGMQFITTWAADGSLIGQTTWDPQGMSSFVGIDTGSTPIAMIALGNDDVFSGATYNVGGLTTIWDNAIWGVPEPTTLPLIGLGLTALAFARRRRLHA